MLTKTRSIILLCMNIKWLIKKSYSALILGTVIYSLELLGSDKVSLNSCNYYLSSRNCRSCMVDIMEEVNKFDIIDTLFIIYPKGDNIEKVNLLKIFKRHWSQNRMIRDTVFSEFEGDLFDPKAKTKFSDSSLNSLFYCSTPLLFKRFNHRITIIYN